MVVLGAGVEGAPSGLSNVVTTAITQHVATSATTVRIRASRARRLIEFRVTGPFSVQERHAGVTVSGGPRLDAGWLGDSVGMDQQARAGRPKMPSEVSPHVSWFDRFATAVADRVARAPFFAACVVLILGWAPTYWLIRDFNTWSLLVNNPTTILTFLLAGLAANTQARATGAQQRKENAIALAVLVLLEQPDEPDARAKAVQELRAAVGLEDRESA